MERVLIEYLSWKLFPISNILKPNSRGYRAAREDKHRAVEVRKAGHCKDKAMRLEITQNSNMWESSLSRESHQYQRMGE